MRINELSKKVNCSVATIIRFLKDRGIRKDFPNDEFRCSYVKVTQEEIALVEKEFAQDKKLKDSADRFTTVRKEIKSIGLKNTLIKYPTEITKPLTKTYPGKHKEKKKYVRKQSNIRMHNVSINDPKYNSSDSVLIKGKEKRPTEEKNNTPSSVSAVSKNLEIITVPWNDVQFQYKKILIHYRDRVYNMQEDRSQAIYTNVVYTFAKKLPKLQFLLRDSNISLLNKIQYEIVFMCLQEHLVSYNNNSFVFESALSKYLPDIIHERGQFDKNPCLKYLQRLQSNKYRLCSIHENGKKENGFIFTIESNNNWFVIVEGAEIKKSPRSKSTYIFKCDRATVENTQQKVYDYFCSEIKHKRRLLRKRDQSMFISQDYFFLNHKTYDLWKEQFDSTILCVEKHQSLKCRKGTDSKSENEYTYRTVPTEHQVNQQHNIIQNSLRKYFLDKEAYVDVVLESDYIDIKGKKKDNTYHYFEIKVMSDAEAIREGLGQLLGYEIRASEPISKLFIVGISKASEDTLRIMKVMREERNTPIWYCHYDISTAKLKIYDGDLG